MSIHKNLTKSEIRDFFSQLYVELKTEENAYSLKINELHNKILQSKLEIEYLEEDIQIKTKLINIIKKIETIDNIILSLDWKKFDVSSLINRIDGEKYHRPFIGNQTEYETFKNK